MALRSLRTVGAAGRVAIFLGLGNAAVSAYWLLGGTALLDTVGGDIERWGRERGPLVLLALTGVVLVKTAVAIVPLVDVDEPWKRRVRWVERLAAWVLVVYGGLLTAVGLLVQSDVIEASKDADTKALAWHTYFWDPWFLLWGGALMIHLRPAPPQVERQVAA